MISRELHRTPKWFFLLRINNLAPPETSIAAFLPPRSTRTRFAPQWLGLNGTWGRNLRPPLKLDGLVEKQCFCRKRVFQPNRLLSSFAWACGAAIAMKISLSRQCTIKPAWDGNISEWQAYCVLRRGRRGGDKLSRRPAPDVLL
jgi:hypothetical protein